MGRRLVTADKIEVPHELPVRLWVNEDLKQNYNTNDLAHKIPRIIEWVNSIHDLESGGVSDTGTNHRGLSALQDGDRTDMESRPGHPAVQCQGRAEAHLGPAPRPKSLANTPGRFKVEPKAPCASSPFPFVAQGTSFSRAGL